MRASFLTNGNNLARARDPGRPEVPRVRGKGNKREQRERERERERDEVNVRSCIVELRAKLKLRAMNDRRWGEPANGAESAPFR